MAFQLTISSFCRVAGAGSAIAAKDALGNNVKVSNWVKTHPAGDRSLTQGLKSDATYLIGGLSFEYTRQADLSSSDFQTTTYSGIWLAPRRACQELTHFSS